MKTLKQLKEENSQEVAVEAEVQDEVEQELTDSEQEVETETESEVEAEAEDEKEESKEEAEIEPWMQTEESATSDDSGFKPDSKYQAKRLRAKLEKKDDELEDLKAKIAALESGQAPRVEKPKTENIVRPTLEQYDYDEDRFNAALDEYYDKRMSNQVTNHAQKAQQEAAEKAQQEAHQNAVKSSVDNHYQKAMKLVESGKVSMELYQESDRNVRQAMERLRPGNGDLIADNIIATLDSIGADSEKVMFMLGRNDSKLDKVTSLLMQDPSGNRATAYLGMLNSEANAVSIKNRRSQAPKPAAKVDGDSNTNSEEAKLKRKWSRETDVAKRIKMKREAKKAGYDTNKW